MPTTVATPVKVVDTKNLSIDEYFGHVASKDGTASFAIVEVRAADEAGFQTPAFAEYIICDRGAIHFEHSDGTVTRIVAGEGAYLPANLRVRWSFPGPCSYAVVCLPAYSPEHCAVEEGGTIVDSAARKKLKEYHDCHAAAVAEAPAADDASSRVVAVKPVAVVDAPGITITEHFGHVATGDGVASLGKAVVKAASEEAWQAPQFDEYVICASGAIDFVHSDGSRVSVTAGQGAFLPRGMRVKWVWPEATTYFVLCLPAFSPELSGREAEDGATVAKDSASMRRLERLHEEQRAANVPAAAASPAKLCELYVRTANAHDLRGLASMLSADVDMFGGPCDLAGLEEFYTSYPEIQWRVTSEYAPLADNPRTVEFAYTRSWRAASGERLSVDAVETIAFDADGKVAKIAYTRAPTEPRAVGA